MGNIEENVQELWEEINKLKEHDIFKIWKSARQGGKVTLTAILELNQNINNLQQHWTRQQEQLDSLEKKLGGENSREYCPSVDEGESFHITSPHDSKLPEPIYLFHDKFNPVMPKLNVPEKYQPYENVSLDRNHPPKKLPEDYKPIKEITTKRKDYKTPKKEPVTFDLNMDIPHDLIEGKLMDAPETIDFNGTLYCKFVDVLKDFKMLGWYGASCKYEALLNE